LAASTGLGGTGSAGPVGKLGVLLGVFSAISLIHAKVTVSRCQTLISSN
jgi:hypothetical protein